MTRLEGEELVHAIKLVRSNVACMYRLPLFVVRRSVSTATALRMPIKVNTAHLHALCYTVAMYGRLVKSENFSM